MVNIEKYRLLLGNNSSNIPNRMGRYSLLLGNNGVSNNIPNYSLGNYSVFDPALKGYDYSQLIQDNNAGKFNTGAFISGILSALAAAAQAMKTPPIPFAQAVTTGGRQMIPPIKDIYPNSQNSVIGYLANYLK